MTVVRLLYVSFSSDQLKMAEKNWKEKCAPLMIRQPGCLTEKLLRCSDAAGELISYSEWDSEESIKMYLESKDHAEIKQHNQNVTGAGILIKNYEIV